VPALPPSAVSSDAGNVASHSAGPSDRSTDRARATASVRGDRPSKRPPVRLDLGGAHRFSLRFEF
jgi:hypothetical protein